MTNSNKNWLLKIRAVVYKTLASFPKKDRERLIGIIESLTVNPYAGDIEKMKGEVYSWRRRSGVYRIFYDIISQEKIIYVFWIERRSSKTY